ncbi:hypothetical protein K4S75_11435 [Staphylococcus epidermidis]|uniref:hypothetical protein n=1 Tax=Staphylococcus warneri TaxID=1292 RepID=UPI0022EFD9BF|nr:hypothetical protein [Staphylococcus warneri]MCG1060659.1 hypothetical protein [Staphylococcus epidermidis]
MNIEKVIYKEKEYRQYNHIYRYTQAMKIIIGILCAINVMESLFVNSNSLQAHIWLVIFVIVGAICISDLIKCHILGEKLKSYAQNIDQIQFNKNDEHSYIVYYSKSLFIVDMVIIVVVVTLIIFKIIDMVMI